MNEQLKQQLAQAIDVVRNGGVIAYPTEAVYGLGCDPHNVDAVNKILELKQRSAHQGLIVVADNWAQVQAWIQPISAEQQAAIMSTPTQATTWIFPASQEAPQRVIAADNTLAIRVSSFSIVRALCQELGPIVSTSANIHGLDAVKTAKEVKDYFSNQLEFILDAPVGEAASPSTIIDVASGKKIR